MSDPKLFDIDGPSEDVNVNDGEKVVARMLTTEGMVMGFNIEAKDERPERTISEDAFNNLRDMMGSWVGTRLSRHHKRTGRGAKLVQVTVSVSLDGEDPFEVTETVPYFAWLDGDRRKRVT